jgi:hypothetical protein
MSENPLCVLLKLESDERGRPRAGPRSPAQRFAGSLVNSRSTLRSVTTPSPLRSRIRQPSGDPSAVDPPVPIPNTEVKRCSPDDSTSIGCAKVGRRQSHAPLPGNRERGSFLAGAAAAYSMEPRIPAAPQAGRACERCGKFDIDWRALRKRSYGARIRFHESSFLCSPVRFAYSPDSGGFHAIVFCSS